MVIMYHDNGLISRGNIDNVMKRLETRGLFLSNYVES